MECNGACVDCGASVARIVPDAHVQELAELLRGRSGEERLANARRFYASRCDGCQAASEKRSQLMAKSFSLAALSTEIPPENVIGDIPEMGNAQLREFIRLYGGSRSLWIGDAPKIGKTRAVCVEGFNLARRDMLKFRYVNCPVEFARLSQLGFEHCGDVVKQSLRGMANADILILDDVDKMPITHTALTALYDIMNPRTMSHKITWTTSNMGGAWIEEAFGEKFGGPIRWRLTQDAVCWEDYKNGREPEAERGRSWETG